MNTSRSSRPRLLLLEDDRATYTALQGILTLRGWDVVLATTVAQARGALAAADAAPDAAVLDLMLPDGSGDDFVRELRNRAADMPIAVTTGVSDPQRLATLGVGRTVLLRKPVMLTDLLKAISPSAA